MRAIDRLQDADEPELDRTRQLEFKGKKWDLERRDPWGYWYFLQGRKAELPEPLAGAFITIDQAQRALHNYFNTYK